MAVKALGQAIIKLKNLIYMKKFALKLAIVAAALMAAGSASAQQDFGPTWGATPEEQQENVMNYNFFRDAYNNKDYDEAIKYLPGLLAGAPMATQNLYIYAVGIYDNRILKATSAAEKKARVDSLMMIYDLRMKNFGDKEQSAPAKVLPMKAQAFMDYRPTDRMGVRKVFRDALAELSNSVDADFVNLYFNELTNDYKNDEIEADEYLEEYDKMEALMLLPNNAENTEAKSTFEALFISSGAANCENLEKMFRPRVAAAPDDVDVLKKTVQYLTRGNCKGEFYGEVAENYYKLQPSSETAMILAAYFEEKKDFSKSLQYLKAAIENENDPESKLKLCIRISASELGSGNIRGAADFARQAIAINSESGLAYYFLAQAYAQGANACSGFDRQAAFWIVYDTFAKARSLVKPGDAVSASDIESQMGSYRGGFPTKEEAFFRGLSDGQSYHVSCGIVSGNTTVRTR